MLRLVKEPEATQEEIQIPESLMNAFGRLNGVYQNILEFLVDENGQPDLTKMGELEKAISSYVQNIHNELNIYYIRCTESPTFNVSTRAEPFSNSAQFEFKR
ncbi:MAG: hypothetical protein WC269_04050, partial [Candidatus Gracilibacteria bacterium]